ncbi:hypothetical protein [Butyrivibrio sp. VCB2001]|uniref:hypothetical protein n=1 Tax=Butyrivibrio sp. VCB2001 TaxID=1280667 RepID=UPI00047BDAB8|nr:hypothetical protein [Butyrivibrio sp. VCB2001]
MKKLRVYSLAITMLFVLTVLGGCGSKTEKWAYDYEPTEAVIALSEDGKATYKGNEYTYTKDDTYITLKDENGEQQKIRYEMNGDKMTLYEESTYTRSGEGEGVVGNWLQGNGWSYVFTDSGEFSEENIFFGHYTVDEEKSRIKLMYDEPMEDAYLYYTLNGDKLTVAYPWPMVRVQ